MKSEKFRSLAGMAFIFFLLFMISACGGPPENAIPKETILPLTTIVSASDYAQVLYVSVAKGSDLEDHGGPENPLKTISFALLSIESSSSDKRSAIFVAEGNYPEVLFNMKSNVDLLGGFNTGTWERDIEKYPVVLSGDGEHRIVSGANNAKLDGFIVTGGKFRGKGAGIACIGVSPEISNNQFINNKTLKPIEWDPEFWHETANDGGAIYCADGASPVITNNLFINNYTENGRGAAIACDNKCKPVISHNIFVKNIAGLDDPMRSSDGGAISIFNWSDAVIENNYFLGNESKSSNDGGAVFVALWSSATISNNLFVNNIAGDDAGGLFVGGQEHRYDGPLDPLPSEDQFFVKIDHNQFFGNRNSSMNSGAMRFTMESRGSFSNNLTAFNNGIYFQRSEVLVQDNIIMDDFLFVETTDDLKPGTINRNFIWGKFNLETAAEVTNNVIRDGYEGEGNKKGAPDFIDDRILFRVLSASMDRKGYSTSLLVTGENLGADELVARVVKSGERWGIIKSNTGNEICIWGDFSGISSFEVVPTYQLRSNP